MQHLLIIRRTLKNCLNIKTYYCKQLERFKNVLQ